MLRLSPKTKHNIARIIPFGLIWLITGWVFLLVESLATGSPGASSQGAIQVNLAVLVFASLAVLLVGFLIGAIEMLYMQNLFRNKSFLTKMLYKLDLYIFILLIIICITYPVAVAIETGLSLTDPEIWYRFRVFLFSRTFVSTLLQMSFSLLLCVLYAEISENLGHAVLVNFFTGKYHQPKEERRIFMFLDMKSSTAFAEQLGHIQYFDLLQDYYRDLSDGIINHSGEVYQYVGDEVVISWAEKKGLENANCIRCFYAMKNDLLGRAAFYQERYGVLPTFKAGVHTGFVTTGEIGALKKEIIFTGDVLNVTSRIQGLCNKFDQELLISRDLREMLGEEFHMVPLGHTSLDGRRQVMELYAVQSGKAAEQPVEEIRSQV